MQHIGNSHGFHFTGGVLLMSFDRVHSYITRQDGSTLVCVDKGRARCMPADSERAKRIIRDKGQPGRPEIVGTYTKDVDPLWLAQDLTEAGVET
jgi:hypothetical protein